MMPDPSLPITLRGERVDVRAEAVAPGESRYLIFRRSDGQRLGSLQVATERTCVTIVSLCIEPLVRGYGAGSDAARTFFAAAAAAGFERVRAWAPENHGLSVYFWIRHGFRPRFGPGPDDGIWLERALPPPRK